MLRLPSCAQRIPKLFSAGGAIEELNHRGHRGAPRKAEAAAAKAESVPRDGVACL
jgi:hypothetical protein